MRGSFLRHSILSPLLAAVLLLSVASGATGVGLLLTTLQIARRSPSKLAPFLFLALACGTVVFRYATKVLGTVAAERWAGKVRIRILLAINNASPEALRKLGKEQIQSALGVDIGRAASAVHSAISMATSCSFLAIILGYCLTIAPYFAVAATASVTVATILHGITRSRLHASIEARSHSGSNLRRRSQIFIWAHDQVFGDPERAALLWNEFRNTERQYVRTSVIQSAWSGLITAQTQIIYLGVVASLLFAGNRMGLDNGAAGAVGVALIYAAGPLRELIVVLPAMSEASVAMRTVDASVERLCTERRCASVSSSYPSAGPADPNHAAPPQEMHRGLMVDGISYRYGHEAGTADVWAGPVSFYARPGDVIIVAGDNGSGKSTLARVISGLYLPSCGSVNFNGLALRAATQEAYRERVRVLFPDSVLFDDITAIESREADELVGRLIESFGLGNRVEISGQTVQNRDQLSTGELARLKLLSVVASPRPLVVLDEWTAHQDASFRSDFYTRWVPELARSGCVIVIVTHDELPHYTADILITLQRGVEPIIVDRRSPILSGAGTSRGRVSASGCACGEDQHSTVGNRDSG